jgi:ATP phosphoribosyltransferase regulatory subunit
MTQLLPEGFRDRLPPFAGRAFDGLAAMVTVMQRHGYALVQPPIAEFEATLDARKGGSRPPNRLRLTDPVSQRTLGLRNDMTVQVGRIAATRLADVARPLRLSYAGPVLKLRAGQLNPDREMTQLGAELIGADSVAAAQEIVALAIEALRAGGATGITVDLTLPDLVETLAAGALPLPFDTLDAVRGELDMKDAGALKALGASAYLPLLSATGPFEAAIEKLAAIDAALDPKGGQLRARIAALRAIAAALPDDVTVTLDPTERHGFEYQSWFGFSLFASGKVAALGRGGTYAIDANSEVATGFSLYPDALFDGAGDAATAKRLFLPIGYDRLAAAALRVQGWTTIAALTEADQAAALGCTHWLDGKSITAI